MVKEFFGAVDIGDGTDFNLFFVERRAE